MFVLTMSTKGQFTLPKSVREALQLQPGCKIRGSVDSGRLVLQPARQEPEELFRKRPKVTRRLTLSDMDEAIARGALRGGL